MILPALCGEVGWIDPHRLTACPQAGNSSGLGKPDDVFWPFAVFTRKNAHFVHGKPGLRQAARKCGIGCGRPNREDATGLECGLGIGQSL